MKQALRKTEYRILAPATFGLVRVGHRRHRETGRSLGAVTASGTSLQGCAAPSKRPGAVEEDEVDPCPNLVGR